MNMTIKLTEEEIAEMMMNDRECLMHIIEKYNIETSVEGARLIEQLRGVKKTLLTD